MEPNKITLVGWVDQVLEHALTKRNIKSGFKATYIWPLDPNAMNKKFQPSNLHTKGSNNEGNETNITSYEQDDQGKGEQDEKKHTQNDQGQGDEGEHEQQYGEEVITTYVLKIHTSVHQLGPSCLNLNLNITQRYYVDMPHSPLMIKDKAKEKV